MNGLFEGHAGENLRKALFVTVVVFAVFLAVEVTTGLLQMRYIGAGIAAANTITVSGHGQALGVPNIATFTFSVVSDRSTVAAAQADATTKANATTAYLTGAGVAAADIQTSNYSIEPQYSYNSPVCTNGFCPPSNQNINRL